MDDKTKKEPKKSVSYTEGRTTYNVEKGEGIIIQGARRAYWRPISKDLDEVVYIHDMGGLGKSQIISEPTNLELFKMLEDLRNEFQLKIDQLQNQNKGTFKVIKDIIGTENSADLFTSSHLFIDTDNLQDAQRIYKVFIEFVDTLGFELVYEDDIEFGSFIGKFIGKVKRFFQSKTVVELAKDGEHALKLAMIDKVQSEVDINQATAAAKLLDATKETKSGVFQIGSLVYIKHYNKEGESIQIIKTLGREEMKTIAQKPDLLNSPKEMLKLIENMVSRTNETMEHKAIES